MPLFLLLLIVPLIEIFLFIQVGGWIGVWPTIGIVVLTAVIGAVMLRHQGLAALRGVQSRLEAGENPGRLLADGAMILVAGVMLLTPGFLTDAIGFLLLMPPVRGRLWTVLAPRLAARTVYGVRAGQTGRTGRTKRVWPGGQTVEGEYQEVDTDDGPDDDPVAERERARPLDRDRR